MISIIVMLILAAWLNEALSKKTAEIQALGLLSAEEARINKWFLGSIYVYYKLKLEDRL